MAEALERKSLYMQWQLGLCFLQYKLKTLTKLFLTRDATAKRRAFSKWQQSRPQRPHLPLFLLSTHLQALFRTVEQAVWRQRTASFSAVKCQLFLTRLNTSVKLKEQSLALMHQRDLREREQAIEALQRRISALQTRPKPSPGVQQALKKATRENRKLQEKLEALEANIEEFLREVRRLSGPQRRRKAVRSRVSVVSADLFQKALT